MKNIFAVSFYCAAVLEYGQPGDEVTSIQAAQDAEGNYTDSDEAVARFNAEVESENGIDRRTFFTVYRIDGDGLSHAVADTTDRAEASQIAALLNAGLQAAPAVSACADMLRYLKAGPITTRSDRDHCIELLEKVLGE